MHQRQCGVIVKEYVSCPDDAIPLCWRLISSVEFLSNILLGYYGRFLIGFERTGFLHLYGQTLLVESRQGIFNREMGSLFPAFDATQAAAFYFLLQEIREEGFQSPIYAHFNTPSFTLSLLSHDCCHLQSNKNIVILSSEQRGTSFPIRVFILKCQHP